MSKRAIPGRLLYGAAAVFLVAAAPGWIGLPLGLHAPVGAAWAQDEGGGHTDGGHEDGGHEDGGHEDGGHEDGGTDGGHSGGQGGGHGGGEEGETPVVLPLTSESGATSGGAAAAAGDAAAAAAALAATQVKTFSEGYYLRAEIGAARPASSNAFWLPSGYPTDPQVFFDLTSADTAFGGVAFGHDWKNGLRAEVAVSAFGASAFSSQPGYTVPASTESHGSMSGANRSLTAMINGYVEPFGALGQNGKTRPYLSAGLGLANNTMEDWTRDNPASEKPTRSYEGDSNVSLAWSIGFGVSMDVSAPNARAPVFLEVGYRFFDLGNVSGSATQLPGSGKGGTPVQPLNFDVTAQVLSVSIRIPLSDN